MRTSRFRRGLCISAPSFLFALLLFMAPASVLPYPADAVYVPARDYSSTSATRPKWSLTVGTIAAWHGFNKEFVWMGTQTLRRKNLIDVEYSEFPEDPNEQRHPNVYMPLPLYDPASREAAWKKGVKLE